MEKELLNNLVAQVTALGLSVGFVLEGPAAPVEDTNPPEWTFIWASSFAVLALVAVSGLNTKSLQSITDDAQEWLWRSIIIEETKGRFLDGYLLLGLSTEPVVELRNEVTQIELDTSVCRKHVIWPDAEGSWDHKLWAVTCLGLPDIQHSTPQGLAMTSLPAAASRSLKYYETYQKYETVVEKLIEEARSAASKNT